MKTSLPKPGSGTELDLPTAVVNRVRKKLERLDRIRTFRSLVEGGMSQTAAAKEVGVNRSTVSLWADARVVPSVEEMIDRAAVDQMPRTELLARLMDVEWALHGYGNWESGFATAWIQLRNAVDDKVLTEDEYAAVNEFMTRRSADVLARQTCDARTCTTHPEHVYVLCYGQPTVVKSRDVSAWDRMEYEHEGDRRHMTYPITHYVGWTSQQPPVKRVYEHGKGSSRAQVATVPGTAYEESVVKAFGTCPKCGGSLNYFDENTLLASRSEQRQMEVFGTQ